MLAVLIAETSDDTSPDVAEHAAVSVVAGAVAGCASVSTPANSTASSNGRRDEDLPASLRRGMLSPSFISGARSDIARDASSQAGGGGTRPADNLAASAQGPAETKGFQYPHRVIQNPHRVFALGRDSNPRPSGYEPIPGVVARWRQPGPWLRDRDLRLPAPPLCG